MDNKRRRRFLTVAEAARVFRVSEQTIRHACRDGQLTHTRLGRLILIERPKPMVASELQQLGDLLGQTHATFDSVRDGIQGLVRSAAEWAFAAKKHGALLVAGDGVATKEQVDEALRAVEKEMDRLDAVRASLRANLGAA